MRRLATPGWLLCHVVMIALVVAFLRLGWWQFTRAEGGNGLSIGYTLEWPTFAAFVIIVWVREVRATLRSGRTPADKTEAADSGTPDARSAVPTPDVVAQARAARAARTRRTLDAASVNARINEGVSTHD